MDENVNVEQPEVISADPISPEENQPEDDQTQQELEMMATANEDANEDEESSPKAEIEDRGVENQFFDCTAQELSYLCSKRVLTRLEDFGGTEGILSVLRVNPVTGISALNTDDTAQRASAFGKNIMPQAPSKSFLKLFVEALKDPMLILLLIMAVISIVLGVAFPEHSAESTGEEIANRSLGIIEGGAIGLAVFIVSIVTAVNDYRKEKKFKELSKQNDSFDINVIRDGDNKCQIKVQELLVGDIIRLKGGDKVVADGLVLEAERLEIDESAMTGETDMIKKDPLKKPFMLSGCQVQNGTGTMVVTAVGVWSEWGRTLAKLTEKPPENTPLQDKLDYLAKLIGYIGVVFATANFLVLLIGFTIKRAVQTTEGTAAWSLSDLSTIVRYMVIAVTIVVVAVPEGLPLAVTISLAYSVKKMMIDKNLVRHLAACETMGGASNICSDKTGTLTKNEMQVVKGWFVGNFYDGLVNEDEEKTLTKDNFPDLTSTGESSFDLLINGICVNTDADLVNPKEEAQRQYKENLAKWEEAAEYARENGKKLPKKPVDPSLAKKKKNELISEKTYVVTGNKTEGALIIMVNYHFNFVETHIKEVEEADPDAKEGEEGAPIIVKKVGYQYVREIDFDKKKGMVVKPWPFNSTLKRMSTIVKHGDESRIYTKGASEWVLKLCTKFISETGEIVSFKDNDSDADPKETKAWFTENVILRMAQQGYRTLVLGYRDLTEADYPCLEDEEGNILEGQLQPKDAWEQDHFEKDLILIAVVGIKDPIRPPVPDAVKACQHAGITVRMVTGDNIETAKFIAKECGILTEKGDWITGPEFETKKDSEIDEMLPTLQVMARSSPIDKYRLVKRLRDLGHVVAVTGDGTNDAPALKEADVGLSMGIAGTQVAKEASDIIIMDDNFNSIAKAVLWGRSIFENIRKFLQFQVTVNVVALVITIVTAITSFIIPSQDESGESDPPLTAVQLLWVNLIMDTFAALALATEEPEPELMNRKPYGRNEKLITKNMWTAIFTQSGYQLLVLCILYYGGPYFDYSYNSVKNNTIVFNAFVFCQLFNEFNARKINNEFNIFKNLHKSFIFILIFLITMCAQVFIVQYGWKICHTEGLNWWQWIMSVAFGSLSIPIGLIRTGIVKSFLVITRRLGGIDALKAKLTGKKGAEKIDENGEELN